MGWSSGGHGLLWLETEGVGFEPTDPFGSPVFKTGAINHSTTPPCGACQAAAHMPMIPRLGSSRRLFLKGAQEQAAPVGGLHRLAQHLHPPRKLLLEALERLL
jgi:hypothetical protein